MASATAGVAARLVSWSTASRTSVFSLNMMVAPARTSRSAQKPTAGFAVTPENASRAAALHANHQFAGRAAVSRRRASRRARCGLALARMSSIIDMKPTCASACRHTVSGPSAGSRSSAIGKLPGRQQAVGLQLLAAQAHHHHLAAEVRVERDVAQRADRDLGAGGVDGHAAAIGVLQADDVVDVRVQRQQLGLDARHRDGDDPGHALHGRRDRQDVARADGAVGVAVALEREAGQQARRRAPRPWPSAGPRAARAAGIRIRRSCTQLPAGMAFNA